MSQERTEKPTPKRLREARQKGQIARSRDLALAAASIAGTMALARLGEHLVASLTGDLASGLSHFGDHALDTPSAGDVSALIVSRALRIATLVGPIAITTIVAAVGMHGFQGGWTFTAAGFRLNWSRLSPAQGLKRLGGQSPVDLLKTLATAGVVAYLGYQAILAVMADSTRIAWLPTAGAASVAATHLRDLLWNIAWALAVIAAGDYGWQYYRMFRQLKMTRQEVLDEARQSDGSAEVKGRIRRVQREMSRRRMLSDVPRATVVITNPTHFAVALEYKRDRMAAPVVLAKGRDHIAQKIRERAQQHGIPIVENKPLARALFDGAEIGEVIPSPLFAAVAELLAQLVRLRQITL